MSIEQKTGPAATGPRKSEFERHSRSQHENYTTEMETRPTEIDSNVVLTNRCEYPQGILITVIKKIEANGINADLTPVFCKAMGFIMSQPTDGGPS